MEYLIRSQVEKIFYSKFKPLAKDLGFTEIEKKESSAKRYYDWGWVLLDVSFTGYHLNANMGHVTRIHKIEEIAEKFIEETGFTGIQKGNFTTYAVPEDIAWPEVSQNEMRRNFSFQLEYTEESVLKFYDLYAYIIKEKIIPLWEKWQDIKALDKLINKSDDHTASRIFGSFDDFFLRKIIITKLASNPDYEKIFLDTHELLSKAAETDNRYLSYLPVLEKLNEYFKTVEPLA